MYVRRAVWIPVLLVALSMASIEISRRWWQDLPPPGSREDLIARVDAFPSTLLEPRQRQQIQTLLNEVADITLSDIPNDYRGQITGTPRTSLLISKLLLENNFHAQRNLIRVLYHESRHWADLSTPRFASVKQGNFKDPEVLALSGLMEYYAYRDDYTLAVKFNQVDARYRLPECYALDVTGPQRIPVTASLYGFGRSLMQFQSALSADKTKPHEELQQLYLRVKDRLDTDEATRALAGTKPIDCEYKLGFADPA